MGNANNYRLSAFTEREDKNFFFGTEKEARARMKQLHGVHYFNEYYNLTLWKLDVEYDEYLEINTRMTIRNY